MKYRGYYSSCIHCPVRKANIKPDHMQVWKTVKLSLGIRLIHPEFVKKQTNLSVCGHDNFLREFFLSMLGIS